jgi:glycosyltransferase involved in cell wall biosynthesis
MPRVSVLTLSYNKGPFLAECLDSVLAQTFDDWELILVDDGSTDETWEVAQRYAEHDPRIRIFHKENGGAERLAETYNYALERSSGELIAILDGDDAWPTDKLERQVALHEPDVLMSYGRFLLMTEGGMHPGPTPPFEGAISNLDFLRYLLTHRSYMINVTLIMARSALEAVGGFRQDGSRGADMPTGLRISALEGRVAYLPEVLGYWRQHRVQHTRTYGAFIAEYNLMLSLKTLLDLPEAQRAALGLTTRDVIASRRAMIADTYFHLVRTALLNRDRDAVRRFLPELWFWGGTKRRVQAAYAAVGAPFNLTFEPMLRVYERLGRLSRAAR